MARLSQLLIVGALGLALSEATSANVIVPWAQRGGVDTDGDGVPDIVDNAPGVSNNQADTDADGIGDAIDPDMNSIPYLGDPGLGILLPPSIAAGANLVIDYVTFYAVPPGAWGHVDLDFGGNGSYDATFFGPLTAAFNQISVPPGLFVDGAWNLNVPGTYLVHMKAFAPGMYSQNDSISHFDVTAVPENGAFALGTAVLAVAAGLRNYAGRSHGVTAVRSSRVARGK